MNDKYPVYECFYLCHYFTTSNCHVDDVMMILPKLSYALAAVSCTFGIKKETLALYVVDVTNWTYFRYSNIIVNIVNQGLIEKNVLQQYIAV